MQLEPAGFSAELYEKMCAHDLQAKPKLNGHEPEPGVDEFATVRTAKELMSEQAQPVVYCVSDRIPAGLVILGGRPKAKKSWAALQIGIAVASGTETLGKPVQQGRVLGLFLEDNEHRMRRRFQFFALTAETAPDMLHVQHDWPSGILGVSKLERWLGAYPDTKLIIIDVLQRFRGAKDPKQPAYEADYAMMSMLHKLCAVRPQLAILVLHHVRKSQADDPVDALSGTFGIAGAADAYIVLSRRMEQERWAVHINGRDWESWAHDFVWEFREEVGWVQIGELNEDLTTRQAEILGLAQREGHVTPSELASKYGVARQSAAESLSALEKKDLLFNAGKGRYMPTRATVP